MVTDGRVVRRQRNQEMVLDGVVALFEAGQPEPTVDQVSDWSGVSTRSIYRYFHHRDGLLEAALWHLVDRVEADHVLQLGDGAVGERIQAFVEHRLVVFARIAPLVRASSRQARPLPGDAVSEQSRSEQSRSEQSRSEGTRSEQSRSEGTRSDTGVQRPLFATAPSDAFVRDFNRVEPSIRSIAAISADAMFQFDTLDGLAEVVASDTELMTEVLERHLRQQLVEV